MSKRGTGSVIKVRKLSGTGELANPNSKSGAILPVVIGGGVTSLVAIGVQQYVQPTSETNVMLRDNAPLVGAGAGLVTGLALYNLSGQAAGLAASAAAAVTGLALWGINYAARMRMQMAAGSPAATAGMGAVVAEYSAPRRRGTGAAIAFEPTRNRGYGAGPLGQYGETINVRGLAGTGAADTSVFGTTSFKLGSQYGARQRY